MIICLPPVKTAKVICNSDVAFGHAVLYKATEVSGNGRMHPVLRRESWRRFTGGEGSLLKTGWRE